jgi:endonuclease YncB( thermonuclease family)
MNQPNENLQVTWTRPAKLLEVLDWRWQKFSVDVGFHTYSEVVVRTGRLVWGSDTRSFVEEWYDSHTDLVIRTNVNMAHPRDMSRYSATVQGKSKTTGERDDLLRDIEAATQKHKPAKQPDPLEILQVDWTFGAYVLRLVDGDTAEFAADAGFYIRRAITMRLLGVNCPETKGASRPAGLAARTFSRQWYETHTDIVIQTRKDPKRSTDSFRRYLVKVQGKNTMTGIREDLAQCLLATHNAVPFMEDASAP